LFQVNFEEFDDADMKSSTKRTIVVISLLLAVLILLLPNLIQDGAAQSTTPLIVGLLKDSQDQPISEAKVTLMDPSVDLVVNESESQDNGRFALVVPRQVPDELNIHIERPHFQEERIVIPSEGINRLRIGQTVVLEDTVMSREISIAFWVASAVFVAVLILIASDWLHNTLAVLLGATVIYAVTYLGTPIIEDLFIFGFERSLTYIDWNVIFLIMGMMIVIAVVENTGIFQWLAYFAYRVSRGNTILLLIILMLITGIASAFLDNVTTMLLMTPITVQIALAIGVNPLAILIPEVMASNVIGVSTLVGTPTNILIGSFARLSFTDFLRNLTPGVLLAFIGLVLYCVYVYRRELVVAHEASPTLTAKLAESGRITEPENLRKAVWIGAGMLLLFIFGETLHMPPSVTALIGASALLIWIRPNVGHMIEAVDWTTLVFFMMLFIVVGAVQEVGVISLIAEVISSVVGDSLGLAMVVVTSVSAPLSMIIANIPFTAAMLPVIGYLTATVPGAGNNALYYCLSVGSAFGGNGSLIGASANMITAGISGAAGYPITYGYFLRKGIPAVIITVALAMIWLLIRFL